MGGGSRGGGEGRKERLGETDRRGKEGWERGEEERGRGEEGKGGEDKRK